MSGFDTMGAGFDKLANMRATGQYMHHGDQPGDYEQHNQDWGKKSVDSDVIHTEL